jgi:uncharacterized membrane protein YqjE
VRLLWSLPKLAPVLLRHIAAYVDLAANDFARRQRATAATILASVIVGVCLVFALLLGCLLIVALTWDTAYRVAAIAWMGGGFVLVACIALIYRARIVRERVPFLASVRQAWREDRVIIDRILAEEEE